MDTSPYTYAHGTHAAMRADLQENCKYGSCSIRLFNRWLAKDTCGCRSALCLRQAHAQCAVQLVDDGSIWDRLPRLVLVDDRTLLRDRRSQLRLAHLLRHASLLQGHLEVVRHCRMSEGLTILVKLRCVRHLGMCRLVATRGDLLVCLYLLATATRGIHCRRALGCLALRCGLCQDDWAPVLCGACSEGDTARHGAVRRPSGENETKLGAGSLT